MSLLINLPQSGPQTENMLPIPEDVYELELIDRNEPALYDAFQQDPDSDEIKKQLRVRLDFEIRDEGPLNGQRVGDMFTVSLHEKSKLRPFVRSMRGGDDSFSASSYDLDQHIASKNGTGKGGRLRASIARKASGWYEVKNPLVSKMAPPSAAAAATAVGSEPPF